ncbi:MAG: MBL fold metallo-hydrolase [Gemmatimonadota bacterium]
METVRYTTVGSGTVVPDATRGPAGHHVACGDLALLFDLGSGTLQRLARLGISFAELDMVAVTHRHQDHIADLLPLLFALRHTPGVQRVRPLALVGYPGFEDDLDGLASVFGDWVVEPGFPLDVWEADDLPVELDRDAISASLDFRRVDHSPEAVGYRLTLNAAGREVLIAYTGDTAECAEAVELARDADLLIAECSVADEDRVPGHLTPDAVGRLAADASVRSLVATHFYPSALALGEAGIERRIRRHFAGPVALAVDGLEIEL